MRRPRRIQLGSSVSAGVSPHRSTAAKFSCPLAMSTRDFLFLMVVFPLAIILGIVAFVWLQDGSVAHQPARFRVHLPAIDRREAAPYCERNDLLAVEILERVGKRDEPVTLALRDCGECRLEVVIASTSKNSPRVRAASRVALGSDTSPGCVRLESTATRVMLGMASFSRSRRLIE